MTAPADPDRLTTAKRFHAEAMAKLNAKIAAHKGRRDTAQPMIPGIEDPRR